LRAGGKRAVPSTNEFKAMSDVASPAARGIDGRSDTDDLHARPSKKHGQRTCVVRVSAEVGIEMNLRCGIL